jgi:hypothetical protein
MTYVIDSASLKRKQTNRRNNMWNLKQLVVASALVALVGTGCATRSGTGVKVRGLNKAQTVTAQVDLLEVVEVKKEKGSWLKTVSTPFVWVKEHPKESLTGVAVGALGYVAYDKYIRSGSSSHAPPVTPIKGVTQAGNDNKIKISGAEECPDVLQQGNNNEVECEIEQASEMARIEAAVRIAEIEASIEDALEAEEAETIE